MNIETRLADIAQLAQRHFPAQFESGKRLQFRVEQLEKMCREFAFREEAMQQITVRFMADDS